MRKQLTQLGQRELQILHLVWELNEASVSEIHAKLNKTETLAYTTVMTIMKKLAEKSFLTFRQVGNTYIYRAAQKPESVKQNLLDDMISKVFLGSPLDMLQTLVKGTKLSETDRAELKKIIDNLED